MSKYLVNPPQTVANAYEITIEMLSGVPTNGDVWKIGAIRHLRDYSMAIWPNDIAASNRIGLKEAKEIVESIQSAILRDAYADVRIVLPKDDSQDGYHEKHRAVCTVAGMMTLLGYGFRMRGLRDIIV